MAESLEDLQSNPKTFFRASPEMALSFFPLQMDVFHRAISCYMWTMQMYRDPKPLKVPEAKLSSQITSLYSL